MNNIKKLDNLRLRILELSFKSQEGHVPSGLSILDLVWVWYQAQKSHRKSRDSFVLSKGHGCLALYVVLEYFCLLDGQPLESFCEFDSAFGGHPDRTKLTAVEASTGSLGHGLPIAVGIAMRKRKYDDDSLVCCIVGDGEANEGSIWEAALIASNYRLSNLRCVLDNNGSGERALSISQKLPQIFTSVGWQVFEINGHNHQAIEEALFSSSDLTKPRVIIANTVKGYGLESMENKPEWHHRPPPASLVEEFRMRISK